MPSKRGSRRFGSKISNAQKNRARSKAQSAKVKSTKPKRETKTWAEKWGESNVDYSVGKDELAEMLKKVRSSTARRIAALKKSKSFSYAAMQFEQTMKKTYLKGKMPEIEKMSWQSIERELRSHHQFWASKTASARGARKEQIEQSKRIWGVDEHGKPYRTMTFDESVEFWKSYAEFQETYKGQLARYDSNRIQQAVGSAMEVSWWGKSKKKDFDLVKLMDEAMKFLREQEELSERYGYDFQDFDPNHPNRKFQPSQMTKESMEVFRAHGYDFES